MQEKRKHVKYFNNYPQKKLKTYLKCLTPRPKSISGLAKYKLRCQVYYMLINHIPLALTTYYKARSSCNAIQFNYLFVSSELPSLIRDCFIVDMTKSIIWVQLGPISKNKLKTWLAQDFINSAFFLDGHLEFKINAYQGIGRGVLMHYDGTRSFVVDSLQPYILEYKIQVQTVLLQKLPNALVQLIMQY